MPLTSSMALYFISDKLELHFPIPLFGIACILMRISWTFTLLFLHFFSFQMAFSRSMRLDGRKSSLNGTLGHASVPLGLRSTRWKWTGALSSPKSSKLALPNWHRGQQLEQSWPWSNGISLSLAHCFHCLISSPWRNFRMWESIICVWLCWCSRLCPILVSTHPGMLLKPWRCVKSHFPSCSLSVIPSLHLYFHSTPNPGLFFIAALWGSASTRHGLPAASSNKDSNAIRCSSWAPVLRYDPSLRLSVQSPGNNTFYGCWVFETQHCSLGTCRVAN